MLNLTTSRAGLIPKGAGERAIRSDLCAFLASECPGHVILHELVVGGCRADVAAIGEDEILLFEIKSEKDSLDRLPEQMRQFERASHASVVVAHEKHFDRAPYDNGRPRMAWSHTYCADVWAWPGDTGIGSYAWEMRRLRPHHRRTPPDMWRLLELCWREELYAEAEELGLAVPSRANKTIIMRAMLDDLTGRQITRAVCRQLRGRDKKSPD